MKKQTTKSEIIIFVLLIIFLNCLMGFLFAIYFWINPGNVLSILFAEKIILLDIAIVCAIGKALDWSVFNYFSKLKGDVHGPKKPNEKK